MRASLDGIGDFAYKADPDETHKEAGLGIPGRGGAVVLIDNATGAIDNLLLARRQFVSAGRTFKAGVALALTAAPSSGQLDGIHARCFPCSADQVQLKSEVRFAFRRAI